MTDERPFEEDASLDEALPGFEIPADQTEAVPSGGVPVEPAENAVRRLEEQLAEANDRYLRLAADFDNFRKRVARERIDLADKAQAAFVMRLVDVLDDLDRVVGAESGASDDPIRQAIELVDRKLRKELELAGLKRIDPVGQRFDPTSSEAVSVLPPPTPAQDHTVSATFQVGYDFKGNLVRPARVQVYSAEGHA